MILNPYVDMNETHREELDSGWGETLNSMEQRCHRYVLKKVCVSAFTVSDVLEFL